MSVPRQVLDVLCFHFDGPPPKLPRNSEFQRELEEASLITNGDPEKIFTGLKQVGEGASGTVYLATDSRDNQKVTFVE